VWVKTRNGVWVAVNAREASGHVLTGFLKGTGGPRVRKRQPKRCEWSKVPNEGKNHETRFRAVSKVRGGSRSVQKELIVKIKCFLDVKTRAEASWVVAS